MKTSRILIAGGLLVALLLAGCYMMGEDNSGSIALNAQAPSRSLTSGEGPDDEVWLLGFLIEESYEEQLQDLIWMEDLRNDLDLYDKSDVADKWQELIPGAVRFDGGKPYFQFKMNRVDEDAVLPATDDFTIAGIPADKSYFLYIVILEDKIESIDDLGEDPVASMGIHYYNADNFESFSGSVEVPDASGMYYFESWEISQPGSGYNLAGDLWSEEANQPFAIKPGETTVLDILLVDR
jgi:hypothetical protein